MEIFSLLLQKNAFGQTKFQIHARGQKGHFGNFCQKGTFEPMHEI
jgi:hypothetical protein